MVVFDTPLIVELSLEITTTSHPGSFTYGFGVQSECSRSARPLPRLLSKASFLAEGGYFPCATILVAAWPLQHGHVDINRHGIN